jgi:serine/threonine protein phosphatase PrpC
MLITEGESNMGLIAEEILDMSLKKGSRDNMTIIVVKFPGQCIGTGGGVMKRRRQRESKR